MTGKPFYITADRFYKISGSDAVEEINQLVTVLIALMTPVYCLLT